MSYIVTKRMTTDVLHCSGSDSVEVSENGEPVDLVEIENSLPIPSVDPSIDSDSIDQRLYTIHNKGLRRYV